MIFIVVKFKVRPEHSSDWPALVDDFTRATRSEPGNLWFEWSCGVDDPDQYVVVEAFRDGDAGVEHVNTQHFKEFVQRAPSYLAATPEIINVEVPGTSWSEMGEMKVEAGTGGDG